MTILVSVRNEIKLEQEHIALKRNDFLHFTNLFPNIKGKWLNRLFLSFYTLATPEFFALNCHIFNPK